MAENEKNRNLWQDVLKKINEQKGQGALVEVVEPKAPEISQTDKADVEKEAARAVLEKLNQLPNLQPVAKARLGNPNIEEPVHPFSGRTPAIPQMPVQAPPAQEVAPPLAIDQQTAPAQLMPKDFNIPGYDMMQAAEAYGAANGAAKASESAAEYKTAYDKAQQMDRERESFEAERRDKFEKRGEELNSALVDAGKMAVDPDHFWNSRSTSSKIMIGIGMALGSFGGMGNGGRNSAVETINKAINRDLDLQQQAIKNKRENLADRRGLLSDMYLRFKDDTQAMAAAKVAYLQNAQLKLNEIAARYAAPEVRANAAKAIGEIEVKKQAAQMEFWKAWRALQPVGPNANPNQLTEEQRARWVEGYGLATTPAQAADAYKFLPADRLIEKGLNKLIEIAGRGGSSINPSDSAEVAGIRGALTGALSDTLLQGRMSDNDMKFLHELVVDPTKWNSLTSSNIKTLQTVKKVLNDSKNEKLKQMGINPNPLGITDKK